MTTDHDAYAKVVNALTGAVITFKDKDAELHDKARAALDSILDTTPVFAPSIEAMLDRRPLITWIPDVHLAELAPDQWKVMVDSVDIGWTYDSYDKAEIALWAAQATVDRMRKYGASASGY